MDTADRHKRSGEGAALLLLALCALYFWLIGWGVQGLFRSLNEWLGQPQ